LKTFILRYNKIILTSFIIFSFFITLFNYNLINTNTFNFIYNFSFPSFAVSDSNGFIYLVDDQQKRLTKMDKEGRIIFTKYGGTNNKTGFYQLWSIEFDSNDNLYCFDIYNDVKINDEVSVVVRYDSNGRPLGKFLNKEINFRDFTITNDIFYFLSENNNLLTLHEKVTQSSIIKEILTIDTSLSPLFSNFSYSGFRYLKNNRIFILTQNGFFISDENGVLNEITPHLNGAYNGIGYDSINGNIFFADMLNQNIGAYNIESGSVTEIINKNVLNRLYPGRFNKLLFKYIYFNPNTSEIIAIEHISKEIIIFNTETGNVNLINKAEKSFSDYLLHLIPVLLMIIFDILSLIIILYFIFRYIVSKKSLLLKNMIIFSSVFVLSIIIASFYIYSVSIKNFNNQIELQLETISKIASRIILLEDVIEINSQSDFNSLHYENLLNSINSIITSDNSESWDDNIFLYVYKKINGIYYSIADYQSASFFYPFVYAESEFDKILQNKEAGLVKYNDDWSSWTSYITPIVYNGSIIGLIEVGRDSYFIKDIQNNFIFNLSVTIIITLIGFLLIYIGVTYFLLKNIKTLKEAVDMVAAGNLDIDIEIKSNDEFENLAVGFNNMSKRIKSLVLANSRFVPAEFLKYLNKQSVEDIKLGDQIQAKMSILFADIRDFTSLSEEMTPFQTFNFINSYFSRMGPIIRKNNGFIDKYIGDAIMALFPGAPDHALNAAIEMKKALKEYNIHRAKDGYKPINFGIGIHTGDLILGVIGEEMRYDSTVIADSVNLASRLESVTKTYRSDIIISGDVYDNLNNQNNYCCRQLDFIEVKGKKEPIKVYEVFSSPDESTKRLIKIYESALECYLKENFKETIRLIENEIFNKYSDLSSSLLHKKCLNMIEKSTS